jgi:hypothetical protein
LRERKGEEKGGLPAWRVIEVDCTATPIQGIVRFGGILLLPAFRIDSVLGEVSRPMGVVLTSMFVPMDAHTWPGASVRHIASLRSLTCQLMDSAEGTGADGSLTLSKKKGRRKEEKKGEKTRDSRGWSRYMLVAIGEAHRKLAPYLPVVGSAGEHALFLCSKEKGEKGRKSLPGASLSTPRAAQPNMLVDRGNELLSVRFYYRKTCEKAKKGDKNSGGPDVWTANTWPGASPAYTTYLASDRAGIRHCWFTSLCREQRKGT